MSKNLIIYQQSDYVTLDSLNIIRNIQCELNISYGDTTRQKIDIIGTDLEACKLIKLNDMNIQNLF